MGRLPLGPKSKTGPNNRLILFSILRTDVIAVIVTMYCLLRYGFAFYSPNESKTI